MTPLRELWRLVVAFVRSFFHREYSIDDYPLRISRSQLHPGPDRDWVVQVINWPLMIAVGRTREEAMATLGEQIADYRRGHGTLPRPGISVPLPIDFDPFFEHERLIDDFETKVLDLPEEEIIALGPATTLHDLAVEKPVDFYLERIRVVYGVEVKDIEGLTMLEIFKRIDKESDWNDPDL